jgi:hypothetical protein
MFTHMCERLSVAGLCGVGLLGRPFGAAVWAWLVSKAAPVCVLLQSAAIPSEFDGTSGADPGRHEAMLTC